MRHLAFCLLTLALACGDDDGMTGMDSGPDPDSGTTDAGTDSATDMDADVSCTPRDPSSIPNPGSCTAEASDYAVCVDDTWPECVSDTGEYSRIEMSISTIARVRAFEDIAELIFDPESDASSDDFLMARELYQEEEGLDSRVVRRFDPHFTVPDGTDCTLTDTPGMFPDYCVGPSTLQPVLLDAFAEGIAGNSPRVQAGRIEGALIWFLYASVYKESVTCETKAKDCDSTYAYYTGGEEARGGIGLSRYVREVNEYAHDRAWDGVFAVRCWRDLDSGDVAEDLARAQTARTQLDRAVLVGYAGFIAARLRATAAATGDAQAYHWAFVQNAAPALDRSYQDLDSTEAAALATALEGAPGDSDLGALADALEATYGCP
ncbi:MAG: hypothetical protein AAGE52_28660 [Myxococcota bacterium]